MNDSLHDNRRIGWLRGLVCAGVVSAALLDAGCGERDTASPPTPKVATNDVRHEAKQVPDSAGQPPAREQDEFVAASRREMDELRAEIALLRERAENATGVAREELRQELDEMEAKWRDADVSLERLRTESGEAWREMKRGFGEAMAELKESYRKAKEELERS
jgi:hypothetical protein